MAAVRPQCSPKWKESSSNSIETTSYQLICAVIANLLWPARSASHLPSTSGTPTLARRLVLFSSARIRAVLRQSQLALANATLLPLIYQRITKSTFKTSSATSNSSWLRVVKTRFLTFSGQRDQMTLDLLQLDLKNWSFGTLRTWPEGFNRKELSKKWHRPPLCVCLSMKRAGVTLEEIMDSFTFGTSSALSSKQSRPMPLQSPLSLFKVTRLYLAAKMQRLQ